jgi:hypothetical protein
MWRSPRVWFTPIGMSWVWFTPIGMCEATIQLMSKTVKPVYKGHSRQPENVPIMNDFPCMHYSLMERMRLPLLIDRFDWSFWVSCTKSVVYFLVYLWIHFPLRQASLNIVESQNNYNPRPCDPNSNPLDLKIFCSLLSILKCISLVYLIYFLTILLHETFTINSRTLHHWKLHLKGPFFPK